MNKSLFTAEQFEDLKREFVEFILMKCLRGYERLDT